MIGMPVRQCPRCELRFTSRSELEYHLSNDHQPPRAEIPPVTIDVVEAPVEVSSMQTTQNSTNSIDAASAPDSTHRWLGPSGWLFLVVGLVVIALLGWLPSTAAALIAAALVVVMAAANMWRARTRTPQREPGG
jgi:hypothetical protein